MRVALASFAHLHAEAYLPLLQAMPDVEVIGLADHDIERGRHFARYFETPYFPSYQALVAEKPDGVVVCTENNLHFEVASLFAESGIHVLCEKPLATTLLDAQHLVKAAHEGGVYLMTAFPMRFSAPLLEVKQILAGGGLGRVYALNTVNQGECPKHLRPWFVDKDLAGGGALIDHIVHLADVMRWYLGQEVTEVYAQANAILYGNEVDVETGGLVMLTFADGTFASIDCSWSKPPYYPTWGGLALTLIGEKGVITVDAFKQVMTVYRHRLGRPTFTYWGSDANAAMLRDFVEAIHEGRPPRVTGEDGLKALEIALAAYRCAASGQPVPLPLA
jgi:predicted dehydrogenase